MDVNAPDFWDQLQAHPELMDQLMGLGELNHRRAMIEAMSQPRGDHYATGLGAALGGAGDLLRQVGGQYQADKTGKQIGEGRKAYLRAFLAAMREPLPGTGPDQLHHAGIAGPPPLPQQDGFTQNGLGLDLTRG